MKRNYLFLFAFLLTLLPQVVNADTWSFEWNTSKANGGQGFYNFGTNRVDKDFYTAELNGLQWNISAVGTTTYAYTANKGQYVGSASEPPSSVRLWTGGIVGKVTAVRVKAYLQKAEYAGDVSVKVNGSSYLCGKSASASLSATETEYAFTIAGAQEGEIDITINQTSENKGPVYLRKIEVDYEKEQSAVMPPVFTPAAGTYDEAQSVAITTEATTTAENRIIYYTTDGSNPKLADGTRMTYTAPLDIAETTTIKAVAQEGEEYSDVVEAKYVIRKDPQLSFYQQNITLTSGDDGYADLLNPNKLSPIEYSSSQWDVCSVDDKGFLATSYVEFTQTVIITATFAGNDEFKPGEAKMFVTVEAKQPLKTPVVTPLGGTFDAPQEVTVTTDDENAVTIWYSTEAKDAEEFQDDYTKSTVVEGKTTSFTIDKSCTLYVMTRGYNQNSEVVTAQFVINEPLKADFTTDRAATAYYDQEFDSPEGMADWTAGDGWKLKNMGFSAIKADDAYSIAISYNAQETGNAKLESPELTIEEGSSVEFYAYFQAPYLVFGKWTFNIIDTETNESATLLNAFDWAQDNSYTGPDWNKFSFDLAAYTGKKVKFVFDYPFGGEDLALDAFRLVKTDPAAADEIHIFEGESITFKSLAKGSPETLQWEFPGADTETSAEENPVVRYNVAGTYDVSLTVKRGDESDKMERKGLVVVSQKAPTALIGLPEEGYESPWVGVFVPTDVPVTFRDLSTGNPTEWNWVFQFADKETSTEQNPTVTFIKKGTVSVGLTAKNAAGQSNDVLQYAVQAGGAQYVWNISSEENKNLEKITLGWYGNYAGSNWLGLNKFAEKYKAPLADASIAEVTVYFASVTALDPDYPVVLTVNAVADNGEPGEVLATSTVKAADLQYSDDDYLATKFNLDTTVDLKAGEEFFVVVGPFPNSSLEESPYTSDDISIFCLRRGEGNKNTAWQLVEDQDENGNGLGSFKWFENTDDPTSMAIAPCVEYKGKVDGIETAGSDVQQNAKVVSVYTVSGQLTDAPRQGGMYIVRYSDGTCRKVVWK